MIMVEIVVLALACIGLGGVIGWTARAVWYVPKLDGSHERINRYDQR